MSLFFLGRYTSSKQTGNVELPVRSIAVLPFENLSGNPVFARVLGLRPLPDRSTRHAPCRIGLRAQCAEDSREIRSQIGNGRRRPDAANSFPRLLHCDILFHTRGLDRPVPFMPQMPFFSLPCTGAPPFSFTNSKQLRVCHLLGADFFFPVITSG